MKKKLELSRNSYLEFEIHICLNKLVIVNTFNGFFMSWIWSNTWRFVIKMSLFLFKLSTTLLLRAYALFTNSRHRWWGDPDDRTPKGDKNISKTQNNLNGSNIDPKIPPQLKPTQRRIAQDPTQKTKVEASPPSQLTPPLSFRHAISISQLNHTWLSK